MTGGMAYIYDPDGQFEGQINPETLELHRLEEDHWKDELKALLESHLGYTNSPQAARILTNWDREIGKFWHVVPSEIVKTLPHPLTAGSSGEAIA